MRIVLVVLLVIILNGLFAWLYNQPQDPGSDVAQGRLSSLSYAPFRDGQSPLKEIFPHAGELDKDLQLLAQSTHAIRTYASAEKMGPIAELAGKYGLKVTQGAWLGYGKKDNNKEIAALIRAANKYPDVITRVIVGNEVLLRGEMKPERLLEYIRQVKRAVKQPVSYADVWSMYMKYPQLIEEVDFITIHILPYWEDEPIPVTQAPEHIERVYQAVQREAQTIVDDKPILIGESGWPSQGRQRGFAVPGVVNASSFIRGLIKVANDNGFDYNIVEAFDQKWKSELEGVVGANWGLYSSQRKQLIPLSGPVYENPDWYLRWLTASLLLSLLVFIFRKNCQQLRLSELLVVIVFTQLLLVLLVMAADDLWHTSYSLSAQVQAGIIIALNMLMGGLILQRAYQMLHGSVDWGLSGTRLYQLYVLIVALAVYKTYGFAEWGRYLSFPSVLVYVPVVGIVGLMFTHCIAHKRISRYALDVNHLLGNSVVHYTLEKLLGLLLVIMGVAMIAGETRAFMLGRDMILVYPDFNERLKLSLMFTLGNGQLLIWLCCLVILAIPFILSRRSTV